MAYPHKFNIGDIICLKENLNPKDQVFQVYTISDIHYFKSEPFYAVFETNEHTFDEDKICLIGPEKPTFKLGQVVSINHVPQTVQGVYAKISRSDFTTKYLYQLDGNPPKLIDEYDITAFPVYDNEMFRSGDVVLYKGKAGIVHMHPRSGYVKLYQLRYPDYIPEESLTAVQTSNPKLSKFSVETNNDKFNQPKYSQELIYKTAMHIAPGVISLSKNISKTTVASEVYEYTMAILKRLYPAGDNISSNTDF